MTDSITTLPILFSRTSSGGVQQWQIEVDGSRYRTVHGLTDGKKQTTKWTDCQPTNVGRSNERNAEMQALFEAQSAWKKRKASGYYEDINDIDRSAFVEPMLAQKYDEANIFPVYSQPKLDGIRCVCKKDGMFSRNGKPIVSAPHILEDLQGFFKSHPDAVLDGELYCDKLANDFNKICSLVKKTKPTGLDLKESAEKIQYHVYDVVSQDTFGNRYSWICSNVPDKANSIRIVGTHYVRDTRTLDELYSAYLLSGFEGQMIRLDAPYEHKRSKNLLKRKEFQDAEYKIVSIEEGEGNRKGTAGYAIMQNRDGSTFRSNIKGSHEFLAELLRNKDKHVGQMATIQYFNLTPDNVPRFPFLIAIRNYE